MNMNGLGSSDDKIAAIIAAVKLAERTSYELGFSPVIEPLPFGNFRLSIIVEEDGVIAEADELPAAMERLIRDYMQTPDFVAEQLRRIGLTA